MRKQLSLLLFVLCAVLIACGPNKESLQKSIEEKESQATSLDFEMDTVVAREIIDLYLQYADRFSDDSLAPIYLFKASDVLMGIGDMGTATNVLDRIIDNYGDFEGLPLCYFMKGRAFEEMEDYDAAVSAYKVFLDKFPDHFLAADTRAILPLVQQGMDDEAQLDFILSQASDTLIAQD